eukprot:s1252_g19.t1
MHIEERFKNMPQVMMPMGVPDQPNGPMMDEPSMEALMPPSMLGEDSSISECEAWGSPDEIGLGSVIAEINHEHEPVIGGSKATQATGHFTKAFSDAVINAFKGQFDVETLQLFNEPSDPKKVTMDDEPEVNLVDFEALALEAGEPGDSLEVGPFDKKLVIPPEFKNAVYRLHTNTGHRSPKRVARALLIAPHEAVAQRRT